jgi:hypothetical protein
MSKSITRVAPSTDATRSRLPARLRCLESRHSFTPEKDGATSIWAGYCAVGSATSATLNAFATSSTAGTITSGMTNAQRK